MKVLFITNVPSPYRVDFFNALGELCDLTVLFETKFARDRDKKWTTDSFKSFNAIFLKGIRVGKAEAFCPEVISFLSLKKYDVIVEAFYSSPTGMLAIQHMKTHCIPFILSSDGGLIRNESNFKYSFKQFFISSATMWLSTGEVTTDYLCHYGANRDRVCKYPFTSVKSEDILKYPLSKNEKQYYRDILGMKEKQIVISVGQFIYRKGYDILLESCSTLDKSIGVYIIGGNPTEQYLELKNKLSLENVHFVGFLEKDKLANYYKAADLFVLPTREDIWGLVINEALSYGLPVITTDKCVAGLEMARDCGLIMPFDTDWSNNIQSLLNDDNFVKMQENSLNKARHYSIENMAYRHIEVFEKFRRLKS